MSSRSLGPELGGSFAARAMDDPAVEFHPQAVIEAREARKWYAERNADVAERFLRELDRAVAQMTAAPERWTPHLFGTRQFVFRGFPYSLVYRTRVGGVQVIAVAHAKREPGYWRQRTEGGPPTESAAEGE